MAFLTGILSVAETIAQPNGIPWEWLILKVFSFVVNYGWRVVLFTVLLKLLLYPLDLFQRYKMRKNQKITERLKPEMDRLQKACGGNTQEFQQKQMQLNKREGYSYFSACLPAIVTMLIFFWLFHSLNNISQYMIMRQYLEWCDVYNAAYEQVMPDNYDELTEDEKAAAKMSATETGRKAVYEFYYNNDKTYNQNGTNMENFLWIKNIWSPDVPWKKPILEYDAFLKATGDWSKKSGKLGIEQEKLDAALAQYTDVTGELQKSAENKTNGLLILPVLAAGLSFLSQFISQRQQKKSGQNMGAMGGSMKFMMVLFPIMMVFFSLTYTSAFTLYIVVNSAMTILLNLLSSLIFGIKDKTAEKAATATIIKYGRPDPNDRIKK